jgi:hypothetical protein
MPDINGFMKIVRSNKHEAADTENNKLGGARQSPPFVFSAFKKYQWA